MNKLNIEYMGLNEIIPYEFNPRFNDEAVEKVAESIKAFGFKVPVIIDTNNVLIAGHTRIKASEKIGLKEIPVIRATDLTDEQVKAYRLADNKVAEFSEWDYELLESELSDILNMDMEAFGFEELFDEMEAESDIDLYTDKVETPVYEVTGEKPSLEELFDDEKTNQLISEINSADIPEDLRDFLIYASYRHLKFDYSNIAEYYAHADKEVQELMEKSALVIIDFKQAIEQGYVAVMDAIEKMREEDE